MNRIGCMSGSMCLVNIVDAVLSDVEEVSVSLEI